MHITQILFPLYLALAATASPGGAPSSSNTISARTSFSTIKRFTGQHSPTAKGSRSPRPSASHSPTNPSSSPHLKPSTTETSASTKPSTASNGLRTDYASICKGNALNAKMWEEFDMEGWTDYLANLMPSGNMSFLEYMTANTPGVSRLVCDAGSECDLITTADGCDTTPPMTNPQNWAVIYSIMNVQRLVRIWVQDIETAQSDFNTMNGYMLSTFTSHNFKMAASTWKNSIASGTATALGAILTLSKFILPATWGDAITTVGALVSLGGSGATFGSGILAAMVTKTVEVVEDQLKAVGEMDLWLTSTLRAMRDGLKAWSDNMVNGIVIQGDGQGMYYDNPTGIVSWIKNGSFAESLQDSFNYTVSVEASTLKAIYAAALNNLWVAQGVYMVNTTNGWTYAWSNYTSLQIDKKDMAPSQYNDEVFYVIKHTDGRAPDQAYDKVPGIDDLGNLGLDIKDVIAASAWSMSKIGFNTSWPVDEAMPYLTKGGGPPGGLFMTIPICQLGEMPNPPLELFQTTCNTVDVAPECMFKQYINWSCSKQVQITSGVHQGWPIKLYDPNWSGK